ncbi:MULTISPECIES: hypothetical protein [unclassified Bradyrhizobium]
MNDIVPGITSPLMSMKFGDVADRLRPAAPQGYARMIALRQQRIDRSATRVIVSDQEDEVRQDLLTKQQRRRRLITPKTEGGYGLFAGALNDDGTVKEPADIQVVQIDNEIDRLTAELKRLQDLLEVRAARLQTVDRLVRRCEEWLLGVPSDQRIVDLSPDASEKPVRLEAVPAALEKHRKRRRDLAADRHQTECAPHLSADAKAKMRGMIEARAATGAPVVSPLIEHGDSVEWPKLGGRLELYGYVAKNGDEVRGFAVPGEDAIDSFGVLCWLQKDALIAALEREIDSEADDDAALSDAQRAEKLAVIARDTLATERAISSLIWQLQEAGQPGDHDEDTAIEAVLQVQVVEGAADTGLLGRLARGVRHAFTVTAPV